MRAKYGVKPGEACENCGSDPCYGDTVHVYAIGGGWAYLCHKCWGDCEADRQTGQVLGDDYPEFIEAEAG